MAGRVQLVKYVILGMTVHCSMIYKWPTSMLKNSDKWMHNFSWSGNVEKKKIVTVKLDICCKRLREGGLGIKSIKDFNATSKLHLCWNFLNGGCSWSNVLTARVRRSQGIIKYTIKSSI